MKRFLTVVPVLLLLFHSSLFAQAPVIQWQKTLGSTNGDYPNSIVPTSDGGYIVAGYTEGADADVMGYHGNIILGDLWVIKMDASGAVQWQRTLGGTYSEVYADIHQTPDGGYIIAGSSASVDCGFVGNHGGLDIWLIKLKPNGDTEWQKLLGGSQNEYAISLSPTADGGYMIGGQTNSPDGGDVTGHHGGVSTFDWWVIKVDATGNLIWQKTLGGSADDQCFAVKATPDGGCIAVGNTASSDGDVVGNHGGVFDVWVVKFSSTGVVEWKKAMGGSGSDQAWSVQLTTDGAYILAGVSSSNDGDVSGNHQQVGAFSDFWVVKFSTTGNIIWQKCYGGRFNETAYYIQNTPDGGYVVTGSAESPDGDLTCNAGLTDAWVIKIDATGNLQWGKSMGGSYYDEPHAVQPLPDGSFIIASNTCSVEVPGYHVRGATQGSCSDFWIIKLSAPQATPPPPTVTIGPASRMICHGSPATFTATLTNYSGVKASYLWTRNNLPVGTNSPTYTASDFNNNDVVAVAVTAGSGLCEPGSAQATSSLIVNEVPNPNPNPEIKISSSSTFICACAPVSFKATVTGGGRSPVYQWMLNGSVAGNSGDTWLSASLKPSDVVTCQYSDLNGCVANAPIVSNAISLSPGTGAPATVSISGPKNLPCAGASITFTATPVNAGASPTYQWKVNGNNAGANDPSFTSLTLADGDIVTCSVTPDASNTCVAPGDALSNSIVVVLAGQADPGVTIKISPPADIICKGNTVSFAATPSNAGANPSYQWTVNGQPVGTDAPGFSSQTFSDGDVVKCTIMIDPTYTCALRNTATSPPTILLVHDQPNPTADITASGNGACAGTPIAFSALAKDAGASPSYQWFVNSIPSGNKTPTFSSLQLANNDVITCSVTPGAGACSLNPILSNAIVASVKASPQVTVSPADTIILYGHQASLNASVSANSTSYEWTPADLLLNAGALHSLSVPLTDSITFTLTATTTDGCKASAGEKVLIYRSLGMPNAFTPNGDGVNDVFRIPVSITMQLTEFSVFDRWGNKIFTSRNIGTGWNGTVAGQPAEAGVYVYMITGTDLKGPVTAKGTVVLVR
ncbi:MAG TPA: gliding motility-associated C-terminal domain-containing protein [Puia sp.]|nr:gliding motility-associated C-terminal domain-containing protein [Puia sp.]